MAEIKWIKITVSMFDDEKIKLIEKMPEGISVLLIWIKLLTLAGKCNADGFIYLAENIPYTDEMLSAIFNMPLNTVRLALTTFANFKMVEVNKNQFIKIVNWEKHQNIEGMDRIRQQTKARVEKYREKQKLLSDVTLHETLSNGIDKNKKEDKEEEKEEDIIKGNSPKYLSILKKIKGYPFDYAKDAEYYHTLEERYPTVDLIQMLQDYAAYKLDHPLSKKDNPRSQINTQCKLCIQWNKCLKPIEKKVQKPEDIPEWFKKANGYK